MTNERRHISILVVDDEEDLVEIIESLIGHLYNVKGVFDGRQALDLLRGDESFDLIISDLYMPNIDGLKLYDAVKAENLARAFIFMTAVPHMVLQRADMSHVPTIIKPFNLDQVTDAITKALEN